MLYRLVKLTFKEESVPLFLENFERNKDAIRQFPGCYHLELWQQHEPNANTFFTYSHWESEEHLNAYRASELFQTVWANTKVHFAARPEAWSLAGLSHDPGKKT